MIPTYVIIPERHLSFFRWGSFNVSSSTEYLPLIPNSSFLQNSRAVFIMAFSESTAPVALSSGERCSP